MTPDRTEFKFADTAAADPLTAALTGQGFALVSQVFSGTQIDTLQHKATAAFETSTESVRQKAGAVYAVRNLLDLWPELITIGNRGLLGSLLSKILGPHAGLVRGLFFDKPPEQTWSLPWHQDKLIAVRSESIMPESSLYSKPRLRMGVPHVEPPAEVLESMLTVRIHLDDMTAQNGPLEVMPGSHRYGKQLQLQPFTPQTLHCKAGDVLLMRPLLAHASGKSIEQCMQNRRIIHLEYAASEQLPENAQWWQFYPLYVG